MHNFATFVQLHKKIA